MQKDLCIPTYAIRLESEDTERMLPRAQGNSSGRGVLTCACIVAEDRQHHWRHSQFVLESVVELSNRKPARIY